MLFFTREEDPTFSKDQEYFHGWLREPLVETAKENIKELHWLGNKIADIIGNEQLVMLTPTYLLDDFGWYKDMLGISLYVREYLFEDKLQMVKDVMKDHCKIFHGVEQLVVGNAAAGHEVERMIAVSGAHDDESSDESSDEDEQSKDRGQGTDGDRVPNSQFLGSSENSGENSHVLENHESNEHSASSSGGEPSNHGSLDKDFLYSIDETGCSEDKRDNGNGAPKRSDHSYYTEAAGGPICYKWIVLILLVCFILFLLSFHPRSTMVLFLVSYLAIQQKWASQRSVEATETAKDSKDDLKRDDNAPSGIEGSQEHPDTSGNTEIAASNYSSQGSSESTETSSLRAMDGSNEAIAESSGVSTNPNASTNNLNAPATVKQGQNVLANNFGDNTKISEYSEKWSCIASCLPPHSTDF